MNILKLSIITLSLFVFIGCTQKHTLNKNPMVTKKDIEGSKIYGNQKFTKDTDEGLFILEDGRIYLKTDGRSIIDIIDDFGFKQRINYSIFTKLPNSRIRIANKKDLQAQLPWKDTRGKIYDTFDDFQKDLLLWMNYIYPNNNYQVKKTSSGISIIGDQKSEKSYSKVFLYNTLAKDVKERINTFYSSGTKPEYSIITLPSQNALIIQAKEETIEEISNIIIPIDSNSPQVLIEAQVFEFDDSIGRLIGTSLERIKKGSDYTQTIKTSFSEGVSNSIPIFFNELTNTAKKQVLLYNIAMQDQSGKVIITAEPRILLKPGKTAEVKMETKKYIVVTGVNVSQLESINTGIILKITPTILSEKNILLDLELEQSDFIPTNEQDIVQSINKNIVKTSVVAYDGELISIGGIYLQKKSNFNSGLPHLKDIPLAGFLFGSTNEDSSRIMVEFMIRPSIKNIEDKLNKIKKDVSLINQNTITNNSIQSKKNK